MTQVSANDPRDWYYLGVNQSLSSSLQAKTGELYIAEQQESNNDICAIKDAGGSYVSTWSRYGKSESISLVEAKQQDRFNHHYQYMDYVKCAFLDLNETISLHNFIDNGSKLYRILGINKNYRDSVVEVDMIEIYNTDQTIVSSPNKLTSKYGEE